MHSLLLVIPSLCLAVASVAQAPRPVGALAPATPVPVAEAGLVVDAPTPEVTWAVGRGYKARVDAGGLSFHALPGPSAPHRPVHLRLAGVTIGGEPLPLRHAKLPDGGATCVLDHGSLQQQLALRVEGVEQSFHFAALPTRGELVVRIEVSSELAAVSHAGGVQFGTGVHAVHYGAAVAFDAEGRRIAFPSRWVDGALQLAVPAPFVAAAALPLVIDPLLAPVATVITGPSSGVAGAVAGPDVSYDPATGSYLVVWQRTVSSIDRDVYARRFSPTGSALGSAIAIDISTEDWTQPAVAHRARNAEWLVVAYAASHVFPYPWSVSARRVPHSGAPPAAFPVASATGTPPLPGPVVGGDPYTGNGTVTSLVAWPGASGVAWTTIDENVFVAPVQTLAITGSIVRLAISRSNRVSRWLLAWAAVRPTTTSNVAHYEAARFDFLGTPIPVGGSPVIALGTSPGIGFSVPTGLAVSSPDLLGRYTVSTRDLLHAYVGMVDAGGGVTPRVAIDTVSPGWAPTPTAVETDGVRTLAVCATSSGLVGVLLAGDAAGAWRADESLTVPATGAAAIALASAYAESTTSTVSPFAIVFEESGSVSTGIRFAGYRGYAPFTPFTTFPSACGTPPAITASGVPALGNTATFQLGTAFPLAGFVFGLPAYLPLTGVCPCVLAVDGQFLVGTTLNIAIPANIAFVGQTFSAQGFTFQAGPCLGTVSLTDTIDMRIL